MLQCQAAVLARCDWDVRLDHASHLAPAMTLLRIVRDFSTICTFIANSHVCGVHSTVCVTRKRAIYDDAAHEEEMEVVVQKRRAAVAALADGLDGNYWNRW